MKRNFVLMLSCLLLMSCSVRKHLGEFTETKEVSDKELVRLDVANMNGDSEDELLITTKGNDYFQITITDAELSGFSQFNQ